MTDSMNFGPDWIRNLSSEGSTGGGTSSGTKYQLADYRYGREEMLALFDKNIRPPVSLTNFKSLYSDTTLLPLALMPTSEEDRGWQGRPTSLTGGPPRGRGGSLERGSRVPRGRGGYQSYNSRPGYDSGWGNGEQPDWSPRKEYGTRTASMDNWRRARNMEDDDGWRNVGPLRGPHEKWGRSMSWRGEGESEERTGPPERGGRQNWNDLSRGPPSRRSWENEDHLPEWANESPSESGGTFDEKGAFHGSDDEQLEGREGRAPKREGIQKSTSQQHISHKAHPPLPSSKSTMSLIQPEENVYKKEEPKEDKEVESKTEERTTPVKERKISVPHIPEIINREVPKVDEPPKPEGPSKITEKAKQEHSNGPSLDHRGEVNDFERLQEDFVLKLMGDEEAPKQTPNLNSYDMSGLQPPPNLAAPVYDKWFYQDPQGQMQGPFTNSEMAEWYKAGYFSHQLKVRRQCDERFFLLGELISMCGGSNPFQSSIRFPILRNDISKMPEPDMFQYLSQMVAYKEAQARIVAEPWSALTLQQQELAAQRLIMQQQQQQVPQEHPYMQPPTNPLMHMISQMQQAHKLPGQGMDKSVQNLPNALDPHLQHMQHMGNLLSLQNRLPGGLPNQMSAGGMPGNLPGPVPPENLSSSIPNLQSGMPPMSNIQGSMNAGLGMSIPRSVPVDQLNSGQNNDPISSLLKQLHQQKQQSQQMDSLWQQNQFGIPTSTSQQWQTQTQQDNPMSMWDITHQQKIPTPPTAIHSQTDMNHHQHSQPTVPLKQEKPIKDQEKEQRTKEDPKELKKKKEFEEKLLKKEAEEKRKQEQRRLESEKKLEAEKRRVEEERIRKELERAKREAEEKRMKELEEKRRLKELRKAEDETRKRSEEEKKLEEDKIRLEKEHREAEERQRAEERRLEQIALAKAAPWSQSNSSLGLSLADIQKAEREKRAQDAAIMLQKAQMEKEIQQQQVQLDKPSGIQLSWAKKPVEPRKVKSLAEIQAEEQERLAKEAAEARLRKEKEAREAPQVQSTAGIWSGQNLTWANTSSANWSSSSVGSGFWDDTTTHKQQSNKPSTVSKSNSTNTISNSNSLRQQHQQVASQQKSQQQPSKSKVKKEVNHNNNNGPLADEFSSWCYRTLATISTNVDIPTFVSFLRDIESAYDVREYCKEYLGESNATHQFANNFLEKRRSFKPKNNAHKDDMCSPAPAITPSLQHSTEFQEVKGKNKKNKKSKMLKVDARILGFNVTSAPDRINVGDRDYGDNS